MSCLTRGKEEGCLVRREVLLSLCLCLSSSWRAGCIHSLIHACSISWFSREGNYERRRTEAKHSWYLVWLATCSVFRFLLFTLNSHKRSREPEAAIWGSIPSFLCFSKEIYFLVENHGNRNPWSWFFSIFFFLFTWDAQDFLHFLTSTAEKKPTTQDSWSVSQYQLFFSVSRVLLFVSVFHYCFLDRESSDLRMFFFQRIPMFYSLALESHDVVPLSIWFFDKRNTKKSKTKIDTVIRRHTIRLIKK